MTEDKCPIWGTPAEVTRAADPPAFRVRSPRAGGDYEITDGAKAEIEEGALDERAKAKLTTMLIDRRHDGEDRPIVESKTLVELESVPILSQHERAECLLKYIADRVASSSERSVKIGDPTVPDALAHSESWTDRQVELLLAYMDGMGWVKVVRTLSTKSYSLTRRALKHLEALTEGRSERSVFVAMWFDKGMRNAYENGIKRAIEDTGFVSLRIDEKRDVSRVDEEIINEIKRSQFVVADMTHGADGVRGSVYYEAGFAHGHGLEVIYCCRHDCMDGLPFDTRQYHHIVWATPEELRRELVDRIRARVGSPTGSDG